MEFRMSLGNPWPIKEAENLYISVSPLLLASDPRWATLLDSLLWLFRIHSLAFQATGPRAGLPFWTVRVDWLAILFLLEASEGQVLFTKHSHKESSSLKPTPMGTKAEFGYVSYLLSPSGDWGAPEKEKEWSTCLCFSFWIDGELLVHSSVRFAWTYL